MATIRRKSCQVLLTLKIFIFTLRGEKRISGDDKAEQRIARGSVSAVYDNRKSPVVSVRTKREAVTFSGWLKVFSNLHFLYDSRKIIGAVEADFDLPPPSGAAN